MRITKPALWMIAALLVVPGSAIARKKKVNPKTLKHYIVQITNTSGEVKFKAIVYNKLKDETKKVTDQYAKEVRFYLNQVKQWRSIPANRGKKYDGTGPKRSSLRRVSGKLSYDQAVKLAAEYNKKQAKADEIRRKKTEEAEARREAMRKKFEQARQAAAKKSGAGSSRRGSRASRGGGENAKPAGRRAVVDAGEEEEPLEGEEDL